MLSVPNLKELVLLGGGHSHVEVLRSWGMRPVPGVRLTLITRDMHTPYSGMLPGYVSGFYSYDDCHIDLCRLATFANARLIHAEANGIDVKSRRVLLPARPPVPYDLLSVDIGITPAAAAVPGAAAHTLPVKPIDKFVQQFDALLHRVRESSTSLNIAVVGGGAGGVELALALAYRLRQERSKDSSSKVVQVDTISLFCRGSILADHPLPTAAAVRQLCGSHGVKLFEGAAVTSVQAGRLQTSDGLWHDCDEALWCTQAAAAPWLKGTGLPTDPSGFLLINEFLQSAGGPPEVFATGDVATSIIHPRPKAGVFAVRQGPPLAANLRRSLTGQPLQPFVPQSQALALVSAGNRYAVGSRGWLTFQGAWAWQLKDYIDRTFMEKYGASLPFHDSGSRGMSAMGGPSSSSWWSWVTSVGRQQQQLPGAYQQAGAEELELLAAAAAMRCGGCGAKVGSSTLRRALARVRQYKEQHEQQPGDVQHQQHQQRQVTSAVSGAPDHRALLAQLGLGADDAAVLPPPPPGQLTVSTIDFFRSFWPDAYLLGAIAANHALGDCYAMGATPASALALAVLPFGPSASQENELTDLLTGAMKVLTAAGCELVGGHSSEGAELAAGFAITGHVRPEDLLTKAGLAVGHALILTKPLGTGTILAAAMKGQARGRWVSRCLEGMQVSSAAAAKVLQRHGCSGATDVTGFGLLGHVVEMARASQVQVELQLAALPALPGALECLSAGVVSSLHASNLKAAAVLVGSFVSGTVAGDCCEKADAKRGNAAGNISNLLHDPRYLLLFDPQTAGGLLAGVPEDQAAACVADLQQVGYEEACVIGRVMGGVDNSCQGKGCDLHSSIFPDEFQTDPMVQLRLP